MSETKVHIEDTVPISQECSVEDMLSELRRELALRKNVYPKWIKSGRLDGTQARRQMERLTSAIKLIHNFEMWLRLFDRGEVSL